MNEYTEYDLRDAFYKGREIERYHEYGTAIFKRPTFEGYLRELNEIKDK